MQGTVSGIWSCACSFCYPWYRERQSHLCAFNNGACHLRATFSYLHKNYILPHHLHWKHQKILPTGHRQLMDHIVLGMMWRHRSTVIGPLRKSLLRWKKRPGRVKRWMPETTWGTISGEHVSQESPWRRCWEGFAKVGYFWLNGQLILKHLSQGEWFQKSLLPPVKNGRENKRGVCKYMHLEYLEIC